MPRIVIPAGGWKPRSHQLPLWRYLESGGKRAIEIAHRRWGKDDIALHWAAVSAMTRVGGIFHMLPQYAQARKAIWTAVNPHTGKRRIDEAFPLELRASTNEQEMFIRFKNGSTWQVVGSDNYDRLVGVSVMGVVFSEWALADPAAWAYLAPVVAENNGYAIFITTPRGDNHAKEMLDMARLKPDVWHAEVSTVTDTKAISLSTVEDQRLEYHAIYGIEAGDALIEQEFFCSFTAAILGSYWGKEMNVAEQEGRIGAFPVLDGVPVNTAWDLGVGDSMVIWFWQAAPGPRGQGQIHVVDYYEESGYGIGHYADVIKQKARDGGYERGIDYVPHDARVREQGSWGPDGRAKQRIEVMMEQGLRPRVIKDHKLDDGISAVRQVLHRCRFDAEKTAMGIKGLRQYQREWDQEKRIFKDQPLHNWASHRADGFRTMAIAYREVVPSPADAPPRVLVVGGEDVVPDGMAGVTLEDLWRSKPRGRRRL